jgi:hypothetical protein
LQKSAHPIEVVRLVPDSDVAVGVRGCIEVAP